MDDDSERTTKVTAQGGKVLTIQCLSCAGKTKHSVQAEVEHHTEVANGQFSYWSQHQILECMGCGTTSFQVRSGDSEGWDYDRYGEPLEQIEEKIYPPRLNGRTGIQDEYQIDLDFKVRSIYQETLAALTNGMPVLAGIGLRAIVETVCKERSAVGDNLLKKIDWLKDNGILTPVGASILHKIRNLGNDAAHEVKPHTDQQLGMALDVIEHLLQEVYIMPSRAAREFAPTKSKPAPTIAVTLPPIAVSLPKPGASVTPPP